MPIGADQWRAVTGLNNVRRPRQVRDKLQNLQNYDLFGPVLSFLVTQGLGFILCVISYFMLSSSQPSAAGHRSRSVADTGQGQSIPNTVLFEQSSPSTTCIRLLQITVSVVLLILLIQSGDVETNPGPAGVLTMSDLRIVNHALFHIRVKWRILGLELYLDPGTLDAVEKKCKENPDDCLLDVLQKWIGKGDASWKQLVMVLKRKTVEETGLGDLIEKEHCLQEESAIVAGELPTSSPSSSSPLQEIEANSSLMSYVEHLKSEYLKQMLPSEGLLQPQNKIICRLAMIENEENCLHDSRDEYVRQTIRGRVGDILHSRTPVELKNIIDGDKDRQVVLIEGAPGAGKSSLSLDICKKWSEGYIFQKYKVIILVRLQDPKVQEAKSISQLLPYCDEPKRIESVIKSVNGKNVLWVLDGWDEFPDNLKQTKSLLYDMIHRIKHQSAVIVTSRPVSSVSLHFVVSKRIEVLGFTPEDLKDFFMYRIDNLQSVNILLERVKDHPEVESSCYLPLHAAFVADTFMMKKQSFPTTQYGIFESVVIKCISRYQFKQGKQEIHSLVELPDDVKTNFKAVCKLAYRGILENRVIFTEVDLPTGFNALDLLQEVESILGFENDSPKTYNFLHLSIEEFLAAHHLATKESYEQIWLFRGLMEDKRCLPMLTFYAAKTKLKAFGITDFFSGISEDVLKAENELKVQNGIASLLFAFRCICEAEHPSICKPLAKNFNGKYFSSLKLASLSLLDFYSIGSFLALSSTTDIGGIIKVDFENVNAGNKACNMFTKGMLKCSQNDTKSILFPLSVNFSYSRKMEIDGIAKLLKDTKLLHTLKFGCLPPSMYTVLLEGVQYNSSLHSLGLEIGWSEYLSNIDVGCSFEQMLANNSTLQVLHVTESGVNVICDIAQGLQRNSTLKQLALTSGTQYLKHQRISRRRSNSASDTQYLKHQRISRRRSNSGSRLPDKVVLPTDFCEGVYSKENDFSPISTALITNKSLQILRISFRESRDSGDMFFYNIGCGLEKNTSLQELDISHCNITERGAEPLYKALTVNSNSLLCLNLSSCHLSRNSAHKIFEGIKQNKILEELDLSDCSIKLNAHKAIIYDLLVTNKTLQFLKLSSNKLSDDSAFCLIQYLERNNTLKELHIRDCGVSDIGTELIMKVLMKEFSPLQLVFIERAKISSHKTIEINHFEKIVTQEDRPMMLKSMSITLLSPKGEDVMLEWLCQGPSIECLHIAINNYYKPYLSRHINHQQGDYGYWPPHIDHQQEGEHYQPVYYNQEHLFDDRFKIIGQNRMAYYYTFTFLQDLNKCKSLKTLHIESRHNLNDILSPLGDVLLKNSTLTRLHLDVKSDYLTHLPQYNIKKCWTHFISCLEKNKSLQELRLPNSPFLDLHPINRKEIQDRINISRRETGQPDFIFLESSSCLLNFEQWFSMTGNLTFQ